MLSLKKSNSRLRRLAQQVIDRNRERHPSHLCDVVEQVMAHSGRADPPKSGIKRTKSVASLVRRSSKPRQNSEGVADAERQVDTAACRDRRRSLPSQRFSISSSGASSALSDSSGLGTSPRSLRFVPAGPATAARARPLRSDFEAAPAVWSDTNGQPAHVHKGRSPAARGPTQQDINARHRVTDLALPDLAISLQSTSMLAAEGCKVELPSAVTGLINLGNSCYLASVVQALLATTPLAHFFLGM